MQDTVCLQALACHICAPYMTNGVVDKLASLASFGTVCCGLR